MANREITYYSLLSSVNLRHVESVADEMDEESFVVLGFEKKWFHHLWISANNEAFLEYLSFQSDLNKLDGILSEQLKLYARKNGEGFEKNEGDIYGTYKARKDWLNHTIFICKNEYNKTQNEIFNEAVKWCIEWQKVWLESFNPYTPQNEKETEQRIIEAKPIFNLKAGQVVFEIIKDFFSTEQQTVLLHLIETGNIASEKLLFKGNGNRLTDTFKKLIEHDFITGCKKQDLIKWIISNFSFLHNGKEKKFVYDTVEKTVSRNYFPCKNPLIEVKNGVIQKVIHPNRRSSR